MREWKRGTESFIHPPRKHLCVETSSHGLHCCLSPMALFILLNLSVCTKISVHFYSDPVLSPDSRKYELVFVQATTLIFQI